MSDSVWPHRGQPTRLPHPWDSPGKNTGVGCHFLLQCMKVKSESEVPQSCPTLSDPMDCSPSGPSVHGIFQARVLEWVAIAFSYYDNKSMLDLFTLTLYFMTNSDLMRHSSLIDERWNNSQAKIELEKLKFGDLSYAYLTWFWQVVWIVLDILLH